MNCHKIANYLSTVALAIGLPMGLSTAHASPVSNLPLFAQVDIHVPGIHIEFGEDRRKQLRHAYWLLEQSDRDYHGHRMAAMEEVRKAAHGLGMDLHGEGYGGEKLHWSDKHLREARDILDDLARHSGGHERDHLREAVHQLDRALEVR